MKLQLTLLTCAVLSAACAPKSETSASTQAPTPCEQTATRTIAFFGAEAVDRLEARAFGDDCKHVAIIVSVKSPNGALTIPLAAPISDLRSKMDAAQTLSPDELTSFLKTYVDEVQLDAGASQLPEWKSADPTPGFSQGQELTPEVDRETYIRLRALKPNMLCLKDSVDGSLCQVWDAANDTGRVIVRVS